MVRSKNANISFTAIISSILITLIAAVLLPDLLRSKSSLAADLSLPAHNQVLKASDNYNVPLLRGIKTDELNPYKIQFILEQGDEKSVSREEQDKLIKYFLAALTVNNEDLWVNLSPYEADRVLATNTEKVDIGSELLKQDYLLKQFASSLTNPDTELGRQYWQDNSQSDNFNKVWIVAENVELYQEKNIAYINKASLDIKSEQDYLANKVNFNNNTSQVSDEIIASIKDEVNNGKHFAQLRQLYNSIILAQWFKENVANKFTANYVDQSKLKGIEVEDTQIKDKVFDLYTKSFNEGVYKITKKVNRQKRQYISGGVDLSKKKTSSALNPIDNGLIKSALTIELSEITQNSLYSNSSSSMSIAKKKIIDSETLASLCIELAETGSFKKISILADLKATDFGDHSGILENLLVPRLLKIGNEVAGMPKDLAMEAMANLSIYMKPETVNNLVIPFLIKKGNIQALRKLKSVNRDDLEGKVGQFLTLLLEEVDSHVEITEEGLGASLKNYFAIHNDINEGFMTDLLGVYKLTEVIHYYIAGSLNALTNAGLRVKDVRELRRHLSYGTPINSIITMLGNDKVNGGFADLTRIFVEGGKFNHLMDVVIYFVDKRRAGSVQTLQGVFTLLDNLRAEEDLLSWTKEEWAKVISDVESFYSHGLTVFTYKLFKNFIDRAADPDALFEYVNDMQSVLGPELAFGDYRGFDQELMEKYDFSELDELALLTYYVPAVNHPIQHYAKIFKETKVAIDDEYLYELGDRYKKRFYFDYGKTANTSYLGNENALVELVLELINLFRSKMDLHDLADDSEKKLAFITSMLLKVTTREEKASLLGKSPDGPHDVYNYLNKVLRFYTEILDKHSTDLFLRVEEEFKMHPKAVAQIMSTQINKKYETVENKKDFYKPSSNIAKALKKLKNIDKKEEVIVSVAKIIRDQYLFKRITQTDLQDKAKLLEWLDRFKKDYSVWMGNKIKFNDINLLESVIEEAFNRAVNSIREPISSDDERKLEEYKFQLYSDINKIVKDIQNSLRKFKVTDEIEAERYYTGVYRDLLHQVDYMQTGSCLKYERPKRIKNRKLHGVIPVQDNKGRFQGTGRLQLMEQGFADPEMEKMRDGRKILSLFGISLGHKGGLTVDSALAFNAILETAKVYADENDYILVIPDHFDVQTNYESERTMIRELHYKHGKSIKAKLDASETLSLSTYTYQDVYVVNDVNRVLNDRMDNASSSSSVNKNVNGGIDFKSLISEGAIARDFSIVNNPDIEGYSFEIVLDQPLTQFNDFFEALN